MRGRALLDWCQIATCYEPCAALPWSSGVKRDSWRKWSCTNWVFDDKPTYFVKQLIRFCCCSDSRGSRASSAP